MEFTEKLQPVFAVETPKGMFHRIGRMKDGVVGLFGCWHPEMSLPITRNNLTYRACVACGAHRLFDPETWKMFGPYFSPEVPQTEAQVEKDLNF